MKRIKKRKKGQKRADPDPDRIELIARRVCTILSTLFALSGLILSAAQNTLDGIASILMGVLFIALALRLRYIRVKVGSFEFEAQRD